MEMTSVTALVIQIICMIIFGAAIFVVTRCWIAMFVEHVQDIDKAEARIKLLLEYDNKILIHISNALHKRLDEVMDASKKMKASSPENPVNSTEPPMTHEERLKADKKARAKIASQKYHEKKKREAELLATPRARKPKSLVPEG